MENVAESVRGFIISDLGWTETRNLRMSWRYLQRNDKGYRS